MGTAILTFYRNQYHYPHYTEYLASHGSPMECTPVGMGMKGGQLRVKGTMDDFSKCNYLSLERDGVTIYAWIEDLVFLTDNSFTVTYSVDAWRTYKEEVSLGVQFIARAPAPANPLRRKPDRLLGGADPYNLLESKQYEIEDASKRVLVVQMRIESGELYSRTPVQPTPYDYYFTEYDVNNWQSAYHIEQLLEAASGEKPENLVTMYSIPYMNLSTLSEGSITLHQPDGGTISVAGFKRLGSNDPTPLLNNFTPITFDFNLNELFDGAHSVSVVIPEAGIINIPDEMLDKPNLGIRQDVDMFSGASNYMLVSGQSNFTQSVRGSSISSIPIISDPMDTYLSQNQNGLMTSMIGDVAMVVGGAALAIGAPGIGMALGGAGAMTGVTNILKREATKADLGNNFSNPPAFLGTALASNFSQKFWVVVERQGIDNRQLVWDNYGHVYNMMDTLEFPSKGFIQTEGCAVFNQFYGCAPKWALEEINRLFDGGIMVHDNTA